MCLFKYIKLLIVFFLLFGSVSMADMQSPQTDKDYFELGNSYYREKNYNNAISNYKQTIRETGDYKLKAWSFYNMGNCYYNKGDKEKARKYYIKSLEIDSLDYDAKYNLELLKNLPKSNNNKNKSQNNKNQKDKDNKNAMSKEEADDILNRVSQSEKDTKNKSKSNTGQSQSQNQNKSGKGGNKAKGGEKDW